ncbi:hypothetical protein MKX03_017912 [Papaver bracteatum]|nr:hypothetical protein MKX03_017912 [Papaver bracteatum]
MRELRSGVRRGRSATKAAIEEVERSLADQGRSAMVIRRKRSSIKNNKQQPEPEVEQQQQHDDHNNVDGRELETRRFDEIRENVVEMEDYHDAEENMETGNAHAAEELEEEEEAYTTPTPFEVLTAKKRYLEKGLPRQTRLLHESSSSYEMDGETREGSVSLAAPECEVTNQNCEMYNHKHEGSVPVDIPECETAKDVVVDSINSKKKKKDKVVQTSKAPPVGMVGDEMHRATRLLGKRKTSGTVAVQPNMEDHLIQTPEEYELRGAGKFVSQPTFFQKPNRQALKIAAKFHEQRKLVENEWEEERVSRLRVEDQLLNTQNMVSRLEETLANFTQNDELKKQVNNGSLVCDGSTMAIRTPLRGTGKFETQPTFFQKPKCQAVKVADKLHEQRKLAENEWQEERVSRLRVEDQLLDTQNMVSRLEEMLANFMQNGKSPTSISNKLPLINCGNLGKDLASVSNMLPTNNNEDLEENLASTSNRVSINNKVNWGKGPASTFTRVQLKNNESLGNSPASSSDRANSNNYEPTTSGRSQSRVWRNDEENLPVVQVISSRHVARSVKDSNVSPAIFGTEMELYRDLDDVRYICHMEDLSENCVMAYIRNLYDVLTERGLQHKYEFINPASVSAAKDADLSKIITSRLMNTNCDWVFIPVNPEGAHWLLIAINMVAMSCYWLDPSGLPARYNIKPFVTFGLKGLQTDGVNIKCPKQKNSVECGFYIMKFLREIIDDPKMFTKSEPFLKSMYEQDEIDEVRLEWIRTVEAYV